jgi:YVTN family beta-propeller protein
MGAALDFATDLKPEVRGSSTLRLPVILRSAASVLALGAALIGVAGCGDVFRPPVASISPVGPAAQPTKYALIISDPGGGKAGLFTMVDVSGDTVLNTTAIGIAPKYFALGYSGTEGYVLNGDGSINSFGISSYLLSNQVQTSTLFVGANATSIFPASAYTYITEPYTAGNAKVAEAQGSPPTVKQELSVGDSPVFIAGNASASRVYAISQGANNVTAIQTSTNTISNVIPVGTSPVYGVMSADNNRAFILNQGSNSVSVINVNTNQLDISPTANPIPVGGGPVWADLYAQGSLLVTANSTGNSVSIISIPLCSIVALPGNPNCTTTNPTDASTFGTVLATVPVGTNPQMVSILQDGTRAYVANFNATDVSGFSIAADTRAITGYSVTNNVATINSINDFVANSYVTISNLSNGAFLDGGPYKVLASGLSSNQFQIAITHADVIPTVDSGTATEGIATVTAPNAYTAGSLVMIGGLRQGLGSTLNGGPYPVLAAGLLGTQFEAAVPYYGTAAATTDTGTTSVYGTYGSVSVVNLGTFTVTKTILFDGNTANSDGSTNINHGPYCHPNFINAVQGTPTGKVYATCPDGRLLTILETQTDTVRTTIDLQGFAVQQRVNSQ